MKKKICMLIVVLILISSISFSAFAQELDKEKFDSDVDFMKNVIYFVLNQYQYDVDQNEIMNGLYNGFFSVLDEYSIYYTEEKYQSLITDTAGEFVGIGVQIIDSDGKIVVVTPLPNSPALEVGIKAGDTIKYVDDIDITGYTSSEAANKLIKGKEGTPVKIGIVRDGKNLTFDIIRRTIVTSKVESEIMDNEIGYLKVTEFSDNTTDLVKKELSKFDDNNINKIVIDLRNNGGGTLGAAVDMLNLFVTEGPLVYVDYATGKEDIYTSDLKEQKYKIALLINSGSASATEIFAGAVKYKNEGILVGTQSFGKGIVQSLYKLNGAGVKFTTAEYFSVNRTPVHKIGITPDILVENPTIDFAKYPQFSKENKSNLGDVSLDVLSAEMILQTLGYSVNKPDGVYDKTSFEQIQKFQDDNNLYAYGIIDITTQNTLYAALDNYAKNSLPDLQLQTAIEQLNK
ncbi:carboxyl-terminal processing protease [Sedimentibacter acidaminivorans]|uniref:Carboxyl-terminal processing protease n=1 Tax=Sedimentibacter acidaminivorans TaxID=913099 RepID=A0ABS4GH34_9FIRM|nr:S41 family peptidase [Sedimentibacter acidaminivorans]MBP1927013.1 carboxyl-terminal processing protease [Sedimentibacter acidaminivorans]